MSKRRKPRTDAAVLCDPDLPVTSPRLSFEQRVMWIWARVAEAASHEMFLPIRKIEEEEKKERKTLGCHHHHTGAMR